ncbi:unnamed protein product [Orchesella dallaii]|uniref:Uncharacterized protein n=1 Tax=Orchesella dallaii TaxID=48710 RepID=A0ABP1RN38_9HEXA
MTKAMLKSTLILRTEVTRGEQFCEETGQQLNPNSPPLEEEANLRNGYNDNNYQFVGESETILDAAEYYAIPKEVYQRIVMERDALILGMQQGAAFTQEMQRQHDALIQAMQRKLDVLIHGMQDTDVSTRIK